MSAAATFWNLQNRKYARVAREIVAAGILGVNGDNPEFSLTEWVEKNLDPEVVEKREACKARLRKVDAFATAAEQRRAIEQIEDLEAEILLLAAEEAYMLGIAVGRLLGGGR
jgi:hypothetical protein